MPVKSPACTRGDGYPTNHHRRERHEAFTHFLKIGMVFAEAMGDRETHSGSAGWQIRDKLPLNLSTLRFR